MEYIIFTKKTTVDQETLYSCYHTCTNKTEAVDRFNEKVAGLYKIGNFNYKQLEIYFAGFDSNTELGKELHGKETFSTEDLLNIILNLESAECLYTCSATGAKMSSNEVTCSDCGKPLTILPASNATTTALGKHLCQSCWNDYLNTREGLVEYFILVATSKIRAEAFLKEDLEAMYKAYQLFGPKLKAQLTEELYNMYKDAFIVLVQKVIES